MKGKLLCSLLACVLIITLFLTSCAEPTTPTPTTPTPAAPTPTAPAPTTPSAAPAKVTIALSTPATIVDPAGTVGSSSYHISCNVFEALLKWDGDNKIVPNLATSWTTSPDGKTMEFKLREGVKFSSGDPFTAKDVAFTFEYFPINNIMVADGLERISFESVEVIDDYTVRLHFSKFNIMTQTMFAGDFFMFSKDYYDKVGADEYAKHPVGTGRYKIADWKAGEYVDLVANENYWGEKPQIQEARFVFAADAGTRVAMLQAGEVDMIQDVTWGTVATLEKDGFTRTDIPDIHSMCLEFQLYNPNTPWADLKVRQAINYALDKDSVIQTLFAGVPKKAVYQHPWEPGYDPTLQPAYPYDLEKAKQLMAEAGYADGFEMPLYYRSTDSWCRDLVDWVSDSLGQLNITCKTTGVAMGPDFFGLYRSMHLDTEAEATLLADAPLPGNETPYTSLNNNFALSHPLSWYGTEELEAVIQQVANTIDDEERAKLITRAFKMVDADMPKIFIGVIVFVYMYNPNIEYTSSWGSRWTFPTHLEDLTIK